MKKKNICFSIIVFSILYGCKDPENVGLNVLPESDLTGLGFTDTVSLATAVWKEDSIPVRSDYSAHLLGNIDDNVFGKSKAGLYTQLVVTNTSPNFGNNPGCDSVVLSFVLSGYYGDTANTTHLFSAYRLNEDINKDSTRYSNDQPVTSDFLGTYSVSNFNPKDSVTINGVKAPHLKILLDTVNLGKLLLTNSSWFSDPTNFNNNFKGIYLTDSITSGSGCIFYCALGSSLQSKLRIHYHNDSNDSLYYDLILNGGAHFNYFEHDFSTSVFGNNFNDTVFGSNLCYVQSMGGVKTKIEFPFLDELTQQGNIAINNADLIIMADNSNSSLYPAHTKLGLTGIDSAGKSYFLPDNIDNASLFGGELSSQNTYTFNITRYLQQVLSGSRIDYGLFLVATGSAVTANRTIVGGSANSSLKMKLQITYSKIN